MIETVQSAFAQLAGNKPKILSFVINPGEEHKNRDTKAQVEDFMLSQACTRDTCLIALGYNLVLD